MYWNDRSSMLPVLPVSGLIETWDVLKFKFSNNLSIVTDRLIETWDVLKSWT